MERNQTERGEDIARIGEDFRKRERERDQREIEREFMKGKMREFNYHSKTCLPLTTPAYLQAYN